MTTENPTHCPRRHTATTRSTHKSHPLIKKNKYKKRGKDTKNDKNGINPAINATKKQPTPSNAPTAHARGALLIHQKPSTHT